MQIQQNIFTKQEEGWIAMRTDLRKYLVNTTQTNRDILDHLMDCGAFDKTKAKTIKEIAEALQLHHKYIGPALKEMSASGWLLKYKESRFIYYYANNERVNGMSPTASPEKVFTKVEKPNTPKEKKLTPLKENLEAKEIFDLYLKLYPKKGAYKYREEKIERAIKDYDFETIKSIVEWFPKNTWWNENNRIDLYSNILAPTRIDDWISQMSTGDKKTPHETEEQRRARIKNEKMKEQSKQFLAQQREIAESANVTVISDFAKKFKAID